MLFRFSAVLNRTVKKMQQYTKGCVLSSVAVACWLGLGMNLLLSLSLVFVLYVLTGGWRFVKIVFLTLPRDLRALIVLLKLKKQIKTFSSRKIGVPSIFYEVCDRQPEKLCFIDALEGRKWTYREVDTYSNQVANHFLSLGCQPGDSVAVFMESSSQYVGLWLGLAKIGVVPALINYNLRLNALVHCLKAASVKSVVYGSELRSAIEEAAHLLPATLPLYELGPIDSSSPTLLDQTILSASCSRPPLMKYDFNSPLIFIYTSGTTGLPKAAKVVHSRYFYMASSIYNFGNMNSSSVIYDTLPLYHTAGGILGVGQALMNGVTVVIRKRFSASNFWFDCIKYNCTSAQYIGEICRYLLAQPTRTEDRMHQVTMMYGNGLKPQIWTEFRDRFGIKKITEFYGATESNANAVNIDNRVGCVGFTSMIAPSMHPISVILVDKQTGAPLRGADGLCMRAPPGEPGELVGKIQNTDAIHRFDGYSTNDATSKKVAHDVFSHGDSYFLTGDVLTMDEFGYLYFMDRTGDTFRWKGENVSTSEVEALVSNAIDKKDAVAYGVEVQGLEGRAGMVAIEDPHGLVDVTSLYKKLTSVLPNYARPVFVRMLKAASKTGTFKLKKVDLRNEGFDPLKTSDPLFYLNAKLGQYVELTQSAYADIQAGQIRL
ncbi:long-chain fatty acid transport protein 1-like [Watersipora subatra]|uniref:long-chain fatty acid transport protein 1-like n=1 Tax=Watersipora subatra TaxID=2589382 RepID=UPI00355AF9F1